MKYKEEVRITVKIEKELKEKFQEYCETQNRNMSQQIINYIKSCVGGGKTNEILSSRIFNIDDPLFYEELRPVVIRPGWEAGRIGKVNKSVSNSLLTL